MFSCLLGLTNTEVGGDCGGKRGKHAGVASLQLSEDRSSALKWVLLTVVDTAWLRKVECQLAPPHTALFGLFAAR